MCDLLPPIGLPRPVLKCLHHLINLGVGQLAANLAEHGIRKLEPDTKFDLSPTLSLPSRGRITTGRLCRNGPNRPPRDQALKQAARHGLGTRLFRPVAGPREGLGGDARVGVAADGLDDLAGHAVDPARVALGEGAPADGQVGARGVPLSRSRVGRLGPGCHAAGRAVREEGAVRSDVGDQGVDVRGRVGERPARVEGCFGGG